MIKRKPFQGCDYFKKFYYGTEYYRYPTPFQNEWEHDFKQMKKLGFNIIKTESAWASMEPAEGKYAWDEMDRLLDMCEKHDMAFIPNLQWEAAPRWVFRDYDTFRMDQHGQQIAPTTYAMTYVGWLMPCFDNPVTRRLCGRFMREFVKRYRDRECLVAWDVWVEPRSRPGSECACEHSKKKYWQWLKDTFGTVDAFNEKMHKRISQWSDLEPPPYAMEYTEMWLWRQWAVASVTDRVKWAADIHRRLDTTRPVMTHVGGCAIGQDPVNDSSDDWQNARTVDFYGSSLPAYAAIKYSAAMIADWIRSVSPYFWIMEVYPQSGYRAPRRDPRDVAWWVWQCIAHGAKGIEYWQYHTEQFGPESRGYGLTDYDGSQNEMTAMAGNIGNVLSKHGSLFHEAEPVPASVGVLIDQRTDLLSKIECDQTQWEGVRTGTDYLYKNAVRGIYKALLESNIAMDFVTPYQLDQLARYKLIYLPAAIMLDDKTVAALKTYVKKGGVLIAETNTCMRADNTLVNRVTPGCGLDKVFGCRETDWQVVEENTPSFITYKRTRLKAAAFRSALVPDSARVLARWKDRRPAITENRFGKGKAVYIATYPSVAAFAGNDGAAKVIEKLILSNGVAPEVEVSCKSGLVTGKILSKGNKKILFLFNHSEKKVVATVSSPRTKRPVSLAGCKNPATGPNGLRVTIAAKDVAVIIGS